MHSFSAFSNNFTAFDREKIILRIGLNDILKFLKPKTRGRGRGVVHRSLDEVFWFGEGGSIDEKFSLWVVTISQKEFFYERKI